MADISKVTIPLENGGTQTYDIKDATARSAIPTKVSQLEVETTSEEELYLAVVTSEGKLKYIPVSAITQVTTEEGVEINLAANVASVDKLNHSLYIGDKTFNGTEDVTIEVYGGEIEEEIQARTIPSTQSGNMTLIENEEVRHMSSNTSSTELRMN